MNVIAGWYEEATWFGPVTFDGQRLALEPSLAVATHSPDGFSWGYHGSGPTQLALAILLKAGVAPDQATRLAGRFRDEYIAPLPRKSFNIEVDVLGWVATWTA